MSDPKWEVGTEVAVRTYGTVSRITKIKAVGKIHVTTEDGAKWKMRGYRVGGMRWDSVCIAPATLADRDALKRMDDVSTTRNVNVNTLSDDQLARIAAIIREAKS